MGTIIGDYYLIIKSIAKRLSNNLSRQIFSIIVVYLVFPDFKLLVWGSAFVFMGKTFSTLFAHGGTCHGLISYSWKLSEVITGSNFPSTVRTGNHMQWSPTEISNKYNGQPGLFAFTLSHPERKKKKNKQHSWLTPHLIVCSNVNHDRKTHSWINATADCVQSELSNRYPHPTATKVTQAKNTLSICNYNGLDW